MPTDRRKTSLASFVTWRDQTSGKAKRYPNFSVIYGIKGRSTKQSAYAVPFLIELAANPKVNKRDEILGLVGAIAEGNSYLEVHAPHFDVLRARPDIDARLIRELEHVSNARQAIRRHQIVLEQLLNDLDPMVRVAAAHVLTRFPETWTQIEPLLRCVYRQKPTFLLVRAFFGR